MSSSSSGSSSMNVVSGCRAYLKALIDRVPGVKCLVVDAETSGIASMVMTQSQILAKEVFLVERIDADTPGVFKHLNGLFFLRPSADNFLRLVKELKSPRFAEYHLFFTNSVPHALLLRLARCDECEVVKQVQEFYADVYAVNADLFSLNLPSTVGLTQETRVWTAYEEAVFARVVDGLFSACLLTRATKPIVRFQQNSTICRKLATQLQIRILEKNSVFEDPPLRQAAGGQASPVLLLVDRREDPVTPLLNQWTYQGMIHELIGISRNTVDLSKCPEIRKEHEKVVMDSSQDPFFQSNIVANFGDVAAAVNEYVKQYQTEVESKKQISDIEGLQHFVDEIDKYKLLSHNVSKHVAVLHELSRIVEVNQLLSVSSLEQNLACYSNRAEHLKAVQEKLTDPHTANMERLRLVLLYALRYEHDAATADLKIGLSRAGIPPSQVMLVDTLLAYAGSHVRSLDLFQNKNFLTIAKSVVQRGMQGMENVYTQHKSLLASTLEALIKGRLKLNEFPISPIPTGLGITDSSDYHTTTGGTGATFAREGLQYGSGTPTERPSSIIAFMMGGVTFEEARDASALSAQHGCPILLGGSAIHNTSSFLADVAQLAAQQQGGVLAVHQEPSSLSSRLTSTAVDVAGLPSSTATPSIGVFSGAYR